MTDEDARATILGALNEVRKAVTKASRDARNAFHGYSYVSEATLTEQIRPHLVEHGLFLIPSVDSSVKPTIDEAGVTHVVFSYQLAHVSGAVWPQPIRVYGQGNDRDSKGHWGDKGAYKASTGAWKYLLMRLLSLPSGDDPELDGQRPGQARASKARQQEQSPASAGGADPGDKKALFRTVFKRSEELKLPEDRRFEPLDWALSTMGLRVVKQLTTREEMAEAARLVRLYDGKRDG